MVKVAAAVAGLALVMAAGAARADVSWQLTFQDEFNGTSLDTSKWNDMPRWGNDPINNELEAYRPGGVSVSGGALHLTATKLTTPFTYKGVNYNYQSGEVTTFDKFSQEYGKFEIRCKAPDGKGFWPGFWLLPADVSWPPEIDVLEMLGDHANQDQVHFGYIMPGTGGNQGGGTWWTEPGYQIDQWHTYAVEWDPTGITWLVDDQPVWTSSRVGVPSGPMYIIANLAVGGDWPGSPNASTAFPSELTVDYIRAYEAVETPEPATAGLVLAGAGMMLARRRRRASR